MDHLDSRADRVAMTDWGRVTAAHEYADNGWRVLPLYGIAEGRCQCGRPDCHSPGKHPLTPRGVNDATTDHDQISAWWMDYPDANVGVATGRASGLVVVDVDPRNGGMASLDSLTLPTTRAVQTGSGGFHFYLAAPQGGRGQVLAPGVDLKADGGYVVAPPSRHRDGQYVWIDPAATISPAPPSFCVPRELSGPIVVEPDSKDWVAAKLETDCPEGARNTTLTSLAGYFRTVVPESVARAVLWQWNMERCTPHLSVAEFDRTISGIYRRYPGAPERALEIWTARSLLQATFPPITWVVDGLLPEGLAFLAGRPKRGKSWLALQIAVDVVSSGTSLGLTAGGRVLYFALEDSPRRIQARLRQTRGPESDDLLVLNELPVLDQGGVARVTALMDEYQPVLVVIDTLARVMGRRRDPDSTADMTDLLAPLQALALERHAAILLIDHHRKPGDNPSDMIDDITGSSAKVAVADAILGLYRKSGEQDAVLKLTGRDVEEREISLRWDALRFHWCVTAKGELTAQERRAVEFIRQQGEADIPALAAALKIGIRAANYILADLASRGVVEFTKARGDRPGRPSHIYRVKGE